MSVRTNFELVNKRSEMYSERPLPNLSHNKGQLGVPPRAYPHSRLPLDSSSLRETP